MSEQRTDAAERSAHVERGGLARGEMILPVVQVSPGVFKLRAIVVLEQRIAELEADNARLRAAQPAVCCPGFPAAPGGACTCDGSLGLGERGA